MNDMKNVDTLTIYRYTAGSTLEIEDQIGIETTIKVNLGNGKQIERPCTAVHMDELALGIAFSQNFQDENPGHRISPCDSISYEKILICYKKFSTASPIFTATGSVHSGQLLNENYQVVFFTEDMGRHNIIDKIIGYGLKNKINFTNHILMISSRMPLELVVKAHKIGIRNIASISAPTSQAVSYARKNNLNLIGMYRDNRFNIYSK